MDGSFLTEWPIGFAIDPLRGGGFQDVELAVVAGCGRGDADPVDVAIALGGEWGGIEDRPG